MHAVRLYNDLHRAGLTLRTDGETLIVGHSDKLTDRQRAAIRAHKDELIVLLLDASRSTAVLLTTLAMRRCDSFNDSEAARDAMRRDIADTPQHLHQDLVEYFQQFAKGAQP